MSSPVRRPCHSPEAEPDAVPGVPEAFGDHLDRHTGGDEERGVGVAQVVEPDPWQPRRGGDPVEQLAERLRVQEPAGGVAEHPAITLAGQAVAMESLSPGLEVTDRGVVQVDAATAGAG